MGNRRSGRRRIPTTVKQRTGAKIRHDVEAEPRSTAGLPPCPPHIVSDPEARDAWDRLAARLLAQRVLTTAHSEPLALLADGWAHYVRLKGEFATLGYRSVLVQEWTDHEGRVRRRIVENPLCRQLRQQALLLNTLFGEFGQTPASAPKVRTSDGSSDPFESFLSTGTANVVPFPSRTRRKDS